MQLRRIIMWLAMPTIIMVLVAAITYMILAPLPAPILPQGQILDTKTGQAIAGAQLKTRWRLYDYPMLDGAGSYELSSVTVTDDKGRFSLAIPRHRRGIWKTDVYPPIITATGYEPFTFDDRTKITYANGQLVIKLTPE